ncbi:MAG: hypothetical protein MUF04_11680, partial [Akkermansiaceae bacterium]|nr:hypothetical protein [Akkermansiaceae bacterium]
ADGSWFEFRYYRNGNRHDLLNEARNQWLAVEVPLRAGEAVANGWRRTAYGAPDLAHISGIEIHADTWGNGFTLWFDGLGFDLPVGVNSVALDLDGGASRLRVGFDEDVAGSLEIMDLQLTHLESGTPVSVDDMSLAYDSASRTAVVTFPGLPGGLLATGTYRLLLAAGSVEGPCGHFLTPDFSHEFPVLNGDADDDRDGMADTWERDHGLDPADPADAAVDTDGDGQPNAKEYLARTDPRDPASRLAVVSLAREGDDLRIEWFSVPGRRYRLVWSEDLSGWTPLTFGGVEVVVHAAESGDLTFHRFAIPVAPPPAKCYVRVEVLTP